MVWPVGTMLSLSITTETERDNNVTGKKRKLDFLNAIRPSPAASIHWQVLFVAFVSKLHCDKFLTSWPQLDCIPLYSVRCFFHFVSCASWLRLHVCRGHRGICELGVFHVALRSTMAQWCL